jgi:type I restriction enzyme M protein
MNMFLHGKDAARIEWCDTLNSPALVEGDRLMKFDVVVANPPFSLDKWGAEEAGRPLQPLLARHPAQVQGRLRLHHPHDRDRQAQAAAWAWSCRTACCSGAGPRAHPPGADRGEPARRRDRPARQPVHTTGIPVAILVFDRSREKGGANEDRQDVLFIDASRTTQPGKNQNALDEAHLDKVLATYAAPQGGRQVLPPRQPEEIAENDFNLNIPRYVDTFEEEEEIDVAACRSRQL